MAGPRARHCRKAGCRCRHEVCDRGWIDTDERGTSTRPCLDCREDLAVAVLGAADRDDLRRALSNHRGDRSPLGAY